MKWLLPLVACLWTVQMNQRLPAQTLEDLLKPKVSAASLSSESTNQAWKKVVDAFRANDMTKALEEGQHFLSGNYKPSAMQLLGVRVMMGLAGEGNTFESREDQDAYKKLQEERVSITKQYNELLQVIRENDSIIVQITANRTRPVQQGSSNYFTCMEAGRKIDVANVQLAALKEPIETNKKRMAAIQAKSNKALKPMTIRLLDSLIEGGEIEAAAAIANTYIRSAGNDIDVALKQQDIELLQQAAEKADQVIVLLKAEIEPLMARKCYWEASQKEANFLERVKSMSNDKHLARMVQVKAELDPVGLHWHLARGQHLLGVIKAQASLDLAAAQKELAGFRQDYPDHPELQLLESSIASAKTRTAVEVLAEIESKFEEIQRRMDPEKVRAVLTLASENQQTVPGFFADKVSTQTSSGKATTEFGLAPADAKLTKASLQGLAAGLEALEKAGVPENLQTKFATLKTGIEALLTLLA